MQSITESDFQEKISKNDRALSIKVSFLKKPFEHGSLSELTAIVQEESGRIMKCKQQTVGHTLFDCYNTFARNSTTPGHTFLSILECKTNDENCLISTSDKFGKLKPLKWTSMLQDLFVQFFFNQQFETDCMITHNKKKKTITQFSSKKKDLKVIYSDVSSLYFNTKNQSFLASPLHFCYIKGIYGTNLEPCTFPDFKSSTSA